MQRQKADSYLLYGTVITGRGKLSQCLYLICWERFMCLCELNLETALDEIIVSSPTNYVLTDSWCKHLCHTAVPFNLKLGTSLCNVGSTASRVLNPCLYRSYSLTGSGRRLMSSLFLKKVLKGCLW